MIRAMMVMTTSISTSVKPPSRLRRERRDATSTDVWFSELRVADRAMLNLPFSTDDLTDRKQSSHDRNDKAPDDDTDRDDGERADDRYDAIEAALQLGLVEIGNPPGQARQLPRLLADAQHADRHCGQQGRSRERVGELSAVAHSISGCKPRRFSTRDRHDVNQDPQCRRQCDVTAQ